MRMFRIDLGLFNIYIYELAMHGNHHRDEWIPCDQLNARNVVSDDMLRILCLNHCLLREYRVSVWANERSGVNCNSSKIS